MDWSKLPDVLAITCLAAAFASISRSNRTPQHRLWLGGWMLIVLHFMCSVFQNLPDVFGILGQIGALASLIAAGICFMWATVPYETGVRSRRMASVAVLSMSIYVVLAVLPNMPKWSFDLSAIFIATGPMVVAIVYRRNAQHRLRWLTVGFQFALGTFLAVLANWPTADPDFGLNAILFTVFCGCCLYFWACYPRPTTGSIITICGFFAWALVFVIAPMLEVFRPSLHLESEIWNLPKYVVAVGMLLLLLEKQIERSQYLALHDDLTALANRRLFQDRLANAIERARRAGTSLALLQVDLDHFKEVNDTYGHHIGDRLLQHVAHLLGTRVRRSDTVARTGGDEFSLILEEPAGREDARLVAESLANILDEPLDLVGHQIRIGVSIGIAVFPDDAEDAKSLYIAADLKMYKAKHRQRQARLDMHPDVKKMQEAQSIAG
jgi:diguanylate cyclase (GGDEF)-like protein